MEEILSSPDTSEKLKKFVFSKEAKSLLLKCVCEQDAHLASHGDKDKIFRKVHEKFLYTRPLESLIRCKKPSVKNLRDKLRSLLSGRKTKNGTNKTASWIIEEVTDADQLLDEFLLEV